MSIHHLEQVLNVLILLLSIVILVLVQLCNLLAPHLHQDLLWFLHLEDLRRAALMHCLDLHTVRQEL